MELLNKHCYRYKNQTLNVVEVLCAEFNMEILNDTRDQVFDMDKDFYGQTLLLYRIMKNGEESNMKLAPQRNKTDPTPVAKDVADLYDTDLFPKSVLNQTSKVIHLKERVESEKNPKQLVKEKETNLTERYNGNA